MSTTDILIKKLADTINSAPAQKTSPYDTQAEVRRIEGDTAWVHIPGGVDETPVQLTTNAKKGDLVQVRVSGGRAWLYGNKTSPPTDDTKANEAKVIAVTADENAAEALKSANQAAQAAASATIAADHAWDKAEEAETAAEQAQSSADEAAEAASIADGKAVQAKAAADSAQADATAAGVAAGQARTAADSAQADATAAAAAASVADGKAVQASAAAAQANASANNAITQLSIIEDVAGTLAWIQEHGTYSATSDTTVQEGKVYFVYNSSTQDYEPIVSPDPSKNPHTEGWYELDISDSQSDFIMSHLAVTSRGLWVLPSGMGSASDARYAPNYKVLLSNDGMYIYDGNGAQVIQYGANIEFGGSRTFHIGTENAYIVFNPSNGGSITIGGSNITLGSDKSLSELLSELDSAVTITENTLIYDTSYEMSNGVANFTAHVYRGGIDIHTQFETSQFTWYLKSEDGTDYIGSGYTTSVSLDDCGYGSEVIGHFTIQDEADALSIDNDNLTTNNNENISVRASGDAVRVRDLTVSTTIFDSEKIMVIGAEDEHLVSFSTLQDYLNANLDKQVLFDTTANWDSQTTLVSKTNTLYIYTDHQRDSDNNPVAGIKVGDGNAYVVDLPFTDAIAMEHIADTTRHITASERSTWNSHVSNSGIHVTASDKQKWDSAVKCYYAGTDQLVFTVV